MMSNIPIIKRMDNDHQSGVSPVIAVILMVAITVVLSGVVYIWASSFANQAEGSPEYFNVKPELTTTGGNHPDQLLTIDILSGDIIWSEFNVRLNDVVINVSTEQDKAGESEIMDIPNGDYASGGLLLSPGSEYRLKIISIDNNRIVFNDDVICENA